MQTLLSKYGRVSLVLVILVLALIVRLYKVTEIPPGLTWDEAAIGYNGFSVAHTGRDEWLQLLPRSFQSFGDYKAPLAVYLNGLFTLFLGLNPFAVRLPFVLSGVSAVAIMGWLVFEWATFYRVGKKTYREWLVVLGMLLIAFSPWHIHFTRAGFESGLALTLYLFGLASWFRYRSKGQIIWLIFIVFSWVAALYTYHSSKLVLPLVAFILAWYERDWLVSQSKKLLLGFGLGLVLLIPLIHDSLLGKGATRLTQVSEVVANLSLAEKVGLLLSNYFSHFDPRYLVMGYTPTLRHGMTLWGVLLPISGLVLLVWFGFIVYQKVIPKSAYIPLWLIFLGIIPGMLGFDGVPHSNRTLLALPGYLLLIIVAFEQLATHLYQSKINKKVRGSHGEKNVVVKSFLGMSFLLYGISVLTMLHHYFMTFPKLAAADFQNGYFEALEVVNAYEQEKGASLEKIMFTSEYGQPYIYTLFARQATPYAYHAGELIKYEFTDVTAGDLMRENALVVGSGKDDDLPTERADHVIYSPAGEVRFQIFMTDNL